MDQRADQFSLLLEPKRRSTILIFPKKEHSGQLRDKSHQWKMLLPPATECLTLGTGAVVLVLGLRTLMLNAQSMSRLIMSVPYAAIFAGFLLVAPSLQSLRTNLRTFGAFNVATILFLLAWEFGTVACLEKLGLRKSTLCGLCTGLVVWVLCGLVITQT